MEAQSREDSLTAGPMDLVSSKTGTFNTTLCLKMAPQVSSSSSLAGLKVKNSMSSRGLTFYASKTSLAVA